MKKFASIIASRRSATLNLFTCSVPRETKSGGEQVDQKDFICSGKSAKKLAEKAAAMNLTVWNEPSASSEFFLKGTMKADGIHDPVVDWDGNLIRTQIRKI